MDFEEKIRCLKKFRIFVKNVKPGCAPMSLVGTAMPVLVLQARRLSLSPINLLSQLVGVLHWYNRYIVTIVTLLHWYTGTLVQLLHWYNCYIVTWLHWWSCYNFDWFQSLAAPGILRLPRPVTRTQRGQSFPPES